MSSPNHRLHPAILALFIAMVDFEVGQVLLPRFIVSAKIGENGPLSQTPSA